MATLIETLPYNRGLAISYNSVILVMTFNSFVVQGMTACQSLNISYSRRFELLLIRDWAGDRVLYYKQLTELC